MGRQKHSGHFSQRERGGLISPPQNEKACRGRRCGRLIEKNRTDNSRGGVPLSRQTPLGRRSGPSEIEALREEVHRFDENQDTHSRRTLNRLCCSAVIR